MRRLTLSFAISILLTLPALTQRNPNANAGGGSNAGGGESRETVAAPRESGGGYSGGGYTGGGSVSGSGGSREPSSPSRDSGGGMSSSGGSVSNSGGSREPSSPVHSSDGGNARGGGSVSGGRGPGGDIGDREFNSRGHQGKPTNVPTAQPGSPASQLQNKLPASRTAQPASSGKSSNVPVPVPGPPSNPCFGGSQVNGKCVSCGAGGFLSNGQCFVCSFGGVSVDGACYPSCPGGSWNGAECVSNSLLLCPECGRRAEGPAERTCSFEEQRLHDADLQRRDLESRAAGACLFDPVGATCHGLQLQVEQMRLEIDRDWRALDRCQHGL